MQAQPHNQIIRAYQRQQFNEVVNIAKTLSLPSVTRPELLQVIGISARKCADFSLAISAFKHALVLLPDDVNIKNSLALTYKADGNIPSAIEVWQSVVSEAQYNLDVLYNLCHCLFELEQLTEFEKILTIALTHFSDEIKIKRLAAKHFSLNNSKETAKHYYQTILNDYPDDVHLRHDYAVFLRTNAYTEEAIKHYQYLLSVGIDEVSLYHNMGNAYADKGDWQQATNYFALALERDPFYLASLQNLCDLCYEYGQHQHMFTAFDYAVMQSNCPSEVIVAYCEKLLRVNFLSNLQKVLVKVGNKLDDDLHRYYQQIMREPRHRDAEALLAISQSQSLNEAQRLSLVESLLQLARYTDAHRLLSRYILSAEHQQHVLALRYLISRHQPVDKVLRKMTDYVLEYPIQAPDNYADLNAFLQDLIIHLQSLHQGAAEPLEQTVRKGTQTRGNLFDISQSPLIEHIKQEYLKAVNLYQQQLKHLPPLYEGFWDFGIIKFAGSWSVNLSSGGYHNNHIHPMGWLSSVLYIQVPPLNHNSQAACLSLGQANFQEVEAFPAERYIRPVPGKLVLFPSCLWHGTHAFYDEISRLTIACDIQKIEAK